MDNAGRGNFVASPFKYTAADGTVLEWAGRGRFSKDIKRLIEAGDAGLVAALAAHKKPKVTGNPVGRPKGSVAEKSEVKADVAEVMKAAEQV